MRRKWRGFGMGDRREEQLGGERRYREGVRRDLPVVMQVTHDRSSAFHTKIVPSAAQMHSPQSHSPK